MFLGDVQPRGLLELGTASGTFSKWLSERVEWFTTLDIGTPDAPTPGFMQLDILGRPDDVRKLIAEAPRPFVLYCDNGDKQREVEMYGPTLHVGDFMAVHDLGTEVFARNVPDNFTERVVHGLTGFYEKAR